MQFHFIALVAIIIKYLCVIKWLFQYFGKGIFLSNIESVLFGKMKKVLCI